MRTQINKLITFAFFCLVGGSSAALDLAQFESLCSEIGFKKKTEAFGQCVLELADKNKAASVPLSQDEQLCKGYGFKPNTSSFAECKLKLDLAKKQSLEAQEKYNRDKAEYDRQVAAIEKEKEKQRAMRQLELGLRMMGGQSPVDAVNSVGTGMPIAPSRPSPINQTITMPNGRMINCTTLGTNTNCF
jgi:hypothetical protein